MRVMIIISLLLLIYERQFANSCTTFQKIFETEWIRQWRSQASDVLLNMLVEDKHFAALTCNISTRQALQGSLHP
jgi:hypothetical protein